MAKAVPVSPNTVYRVLRENGLKPHLVRKFKLSSDPRFVEKLSDVMVKAMASFGSRAVSF